MHRAVRRASQLVLSHPRVGALTHRGGRGMAMTSLNAASPGEVKAWLDGLDAFLVDCDGVLWRGNDGIAGVADTYETLRAAGKVRRAPPIG
jgi:hypothetical protein